MKNEVTSYISFRGFVNPLILFGLEFIKKNNESFTEVILRVTESVKKKEDLLEWVERSKVKTDLADSIEIIFKERGSTTLRY